MQRKRMPLGPSHGKNSIRTLSPTSVGQCDGRISGKHNTFEIAKTNGVDLQRKRGIPIQIGPINGLKESKSFH